MSEGRLQVQLSKFNINDIPEVTDHKIQEKEQSFDIINLGDNCAELNIKSSKEESEYSVLSKGNKNVSQKIIYCWTDIHTTDTYVVGQTFTQIK